MCRHGSFYNLFDVDSEIGLGVGLRLSGRPAAFMQKVGCHRDHFDAWAAKLLGQGHAVARVEETGDRADGILRREVVEILTPALDRGLLPRRRRGASSRSPRSRVRHPATSYSASPSSTPPRATSHSAIFVDGPSRDARASFLAVVEPREVLVSRSRPEGAVSRESLAAMRHHARRDAADDPDAIPVALRVIERGVAPTPRFSREDTLGRGATFRRVRRARRPRARPRRRRRDGGVGVRHETHGVGRSGVRGALSGAFPEPERRSGRRREGSRRRRRDRSRRSRLRPLRLRPLRLRPLRPLRSPRRVYRSFAASRSRGRGCRSRGFALGVPGRRRHGPRSPSTPRVDPSAASTRRRGGGATRRGGRARGPSERRGEPSRGARGDSVGRAEGHRARDGVGEGARRRLGSRARTRRGEGFDGWRRKRRIDSRKRFRIRRVRRVRRRRRARTDATSRFERSRRPGTEPGRRGSRRRVLVVATRRDARLSQNRRRRRRRRCEGGVGGVTGRRARVSRVSRRRRGRPPRRARRSRRARSRSGVQLSER